MRLVCGITLLICCAPTKAQVTPAPCTVSPKAPSQLILRSSPSSDASISAKVDSRRAGLTRIDTRALKNGVDWVQVRTGNDTGWTLGKTVLCKVTAQQARSIISGEAQQVIQALKSRDTAQLAKLVHPVKGLRFSPYVDVDPKHTVVLTAEQLTDAMRSPAKRIWGSEDGTGDPLSLSFPEYYKRFVYNREFADKGQVTFNEFGKRSTTRPNIREVYPNAIVVQYYVPGRKPESEGMDWASLLLIFEQHESQWYLSALLHDQWTI